MNFNSSPFLILATVTFVLYYLPVDARRGPPLSFICFQF